MPCWSPTRLSLLVLLLLAGSLHGQPDPAPRVILDDLDNPCGLAIQPDTGHLFVSDSGRGRVIRVVDGKAEDAVVGFPCETYGEDPGYRIGPLGLAFVGGASNLLVIGGGGQAAGAEQISIVSVPPPGGEPVRADAAMQFGPLAAEAEVPGEGDFYAVTTTSEAIFVTCQGDDTKGWIAAIPIRKGDQLDRPAGYGRLVRYLATKQYVDADAPSGLVISPRGELTVAQMGELSQVADSRLTFYRLPDGAPLLDLPTGLYDITALTYGPPQAPSNQPQLYALDFAAKVTESAGLYRLDAQMQDGQLGIRPTRIASLERPTSMVFGMDGALYVTLLGSPDGEGPRRSGQLIRFAPGL